MIYTCTLNPSVDYILHVDQLNEGKLNRGSSPAYYPGGKGVNVSRILNRLDTKNTAIGFVGGFTGTFITDALEAEGVETQFIKTDYPTRINLKLKSHVETEINGPGGQIHDLVLDQLKKQIKQMTSDDTLVLAGSLPKSVPSNLYVELAQQAQVRGVRVIADTSSDSLKALLGVPLFLVKPNQDELAELFDVKIDSVEKAIEYGKRLQEKGAEHVLISMGSIGAVYINDKQVMIAKAPKGEVINTVGAGDSTVAGFLAGLNKNSSTKEAFRFAVASGSATAFKEDLAEKKDVEALLHTFDIKESDI
ncbi:1-phosphofructokinase [Pelagirhabdus alkalitolerans]|uniref:Tagatose-6-phosphate kinase n=1 Tax=Pelagirhabdus alkalitolerans TaxID=1612202 RepID=A0A1G6K947_9BACI|nr:1-phosphofructokinase [Pelagirhabdus alkalitolerans]SDC27592.1 1-phosphofructokinase [Pelagirhabdus alkalitolerans]